MRTHLFQVSGLILLAVTFSSCQSGLQQTHQTMTLTDNWEFRQAGDDGIWTPVASMPGCVHNDLLKAGKIPDPFYRLNEREVQWIEKNDWEYRTRFMVAEELAEKNRIALVLEGLDTYVDVYLNDSLILQADNMFVGWEADVKPYLRAGQNELRLYFHSAVNVGMEKLSRLPYLLPATNEIAPEGERTNVFTRKAPFHYGWDWGPRLVTCGVWRPVYLKAYDQVSLEDLFFVPQHIDPEIASYSLELEVNSSAAQDYEFQVQVDGTPVGEVQRRTLVSGHNQVELPLSIADPTFWWPHGLGDPHLYEVTVEITANGRSLHHITDRLGIRTLALVQEPDAAGRSFYFEVNGVPLFAKGANYIPSEIFPQLQDRSTYQRLIDNALAANMNMLRVWGGAVYENDLFYDLCDERGILIWQDFMFACALMPPDPEHLANIQREAEYNVKRLRNHPAMALWCGNNENLMAWHNWGWKTAFEPEVSDLLWKTYETIFYDILPGAVANYHPQLSYWPSSPQSYGDTLADRRSGDEHDWTIWFGQKPFENYWEDVPRFVSEYGIQSFPPPATIDSFAGPSDYGLHTEVMDHRQRSNMNWIAEGFNGNDMMLRYVNAYFQPGDQFLHQVYLTQHMQGLALKTAIEAHRTSMPHCMGSLYWQINDCWPTMSWATVDYYGRWKPAHYLVRQAFAETIVVPKADRDNLSVWVVTDRQEPFEATLSIRSLSFDGDLLHEHQQPLTVAANTSTKVLTTSLTQLLSGAHNRGVVIEVQVKEQGQLLTSNLFYPEKPKYLKLLPAGLTMAVAKVAEGYELTLETDNLAKHVLLLSTAEGHFEDNAFDLLPKQRKQVLFRTDHSLENPQANFSFLTLADLQ